jgi:ferredoxin-NADP reductase
MSTPTNDSGHSVKLLQHLRVAERTLALQFEKPAGFEFIPGQAMDVTLLQPRETDAEGDTRYFSIASAPHEDFLMVATRLRDSAFKRQLPDLRLGTEVRISEPSGSLRLHNKPERAAVFLAGGIGITPVRSILLRAAHDKLPHRLYLFYANRRPEDAAFLDELTGLQKKNPNFTLVATMTGMEKSTRAWSGETGRIGPALLAKHLGGAKSAVYYVIGPPGMVKGARAMLNQTGIDDDDIRAEDFGGY